MVSGNAFITFLKSEFIKIKDKNPRYSIRAYAKFLEVDQSLLVKAFAGKRRFSGETIMKCCQKFNMSPDVFLMDTTRARKSNRSAPDNSSLISDWSCLAILDLFKSRNIEFNETLVSKDSLNRLKKAGLIEHADGEWNLTPSCHELLNSDDVIRMKQKVFLEKSAEALVSVPSDLSDHSSMTIAVEASRIPELKKKLSELRDEMSELLKSNEKADSVYHLNINFFPLTQIP